MITAYGLKLFNRITMKPSDELREVREAHKLDLPALVSYLQDKMDVSDTLKIQQFGFGQSNPTYLLTDRNKAYVLRKKPPGKLLPSAHAVEREYRILKILEKTDVPVPGMVLLCEDADVIGTPFYVMEHVVGRIFRNPTLADMTSRRERFAIYDAMNETLTRIHKVDWQAMGLEDFGMPGNYMARQVGKWSKQYMASKTDPIQSMDNLMEWLPQNIPDDDLTTIVHGDFRLENMILHPTESKVVAVLDWELSTLGHPLADLAYNCMGYYLPSLGGSTFGISDVDFDATGIPTEEAYIAAYCERTHRNSIPSWSFFMAFSMFRLAAIVQGVYRRGLDGNASAANAQKFGIFVQFLSDAGWNLVKPESS
jgi:aminoglycoside phosphotransferase (APT) family kinase protein